MYKNILVPVDLNDEGFADKAIELAVWHAKNSDAKVHLLTVLPGIHNSMVATYFPKDAASQMKKDVKAQLQKVADESLTKAKISNEAHVAEGKPYAAILKHADKLNVDLIIMPSHKRSKLNKAVLGSVASKVVQSAKVSVLVVKPQG
ncbi:putative Universal stress protein A [Vibrio nigripulchritudo MADA3029]|uniref:universal stress protein n=1 Tax=Vibrio nigripulchritudo TaxID=28173 RepID=UPI0003B195D5|nr:universal stress protein [Vibrio nigripulchritudo]CCN45105.1 putative Universal stress protein A [Vibrio nigripulchritudo MADA3020]CCN54443.1 putative Universal stress protein A [Vibrio nigripulchritudo MADA3021]CCN57493.1 putative Universal stress protein A [Vibrio nigripulchritudo MADA3029]